MNSLFFGSIVLAGLQHGLGTDALLELESLGASSILSVEKGEKRLIGLDFRRAKNIETCVSLIGMVGDITILEFDNADFSDKELLAIASLGNAKRLKKLQIGPKCTISNGAVKAIGGFKDLDELALWSNTVTDDGLMSVKHLEKLRGLSLSKAITGKGLSSLMPMKALRKISLRHSRVVDDDLRQLGMLAKLEDVDLAFTAISGLGISYLAKCSLKSLDLEGTALGDKGAQNLGLLKDVVRISIANTKVSDAGLVTLGQCKHLEVLGLMGCPNLTDKTIESLRMNKELWLLNMNNCEGISGNGFAELSALKKLSSISISGCANITDDNFDALKMIPSLRFIGIQGTRVSSRAVDSLRKARPDIRVEYFGN